MKKIIIIPILFLASFLVIFLIGRINDKAPSSVLEQPASAINKSLEAETSFSSINGDQDGVEVTVEDIRKENGKTIIKLALSNHRYDLSSFDAKGQSDFSGIRPSEYIIKSSAMGGHHVEAEMIFAGDLVGRLTIGLSDTLTFDFYI